MLAYQGCKFTSSLPGEQNTTAKAAADSATVQLDVQRNVRPIVLRFNGSNMAM